MRSSSLFRRLALAAPLLLALAGSAVAQTPLNTRAIAPGSGTSGTYPKVLPAPGGGYLLSGYASYGYDSSTVSLLRLDAALNVRRQREWKLPTRLIFANSAAALGSGWVSTGGQISTLSSLELPWIIATDSTLASRWGVVFDNATPAINQLYKLFEQGPRVVAYGHAYGGAGLYRMSAHAATGTGWRGRFFTPPTLSTLAIFGGVADGPASSPRNATHYLCGFAYASANAPTGSDGWIGKIDSTRARWSKRLDAGTIDDKILSVAVTPANHLLAALVQYNPANSRQETILCELDTAGTLLRATRLTLASPGQSLYLRVVLPLPQGDILLAGGMGSTSLTTAVVALSATGAVLWAGQLASGGVAQDLIARPGGGFVVSSNGYTVSELDANGHSCAFSDLPAGSVLSSNAQAAVTVSSLPLTSASVTLHPQPLTLRTRNLAAQSALVCTALGVPDEEPSLSASLTALTVWPQPARESLHLRLPASWQPLLPEEAAGEATLTSLQGVVGWRGPLSTTLALPSLAPGVWVLTARARQRTARRLVVLE